MYRILLSEAIDEAGLRVLKGRAHVMVSPDPSCESVGRLLQDADGLIVRTATQVTREMIEKAKYLKVISRTGGGLNNVDLQAATDCGVVVCGVKGPQDRFVAEHAVTLMAALAKQLFYLDEQVRGNNFKSRFEYRPVGLAGKRAGLIGLGRIGRIVADICHRGLGMEVWAYDPYVDPQSIDPENLFLCDRLDDVIRTADFLSLHVPLTEETHWLMDEARFALMKASAFIINTSRGETIREAALVKALQKGIIAGAGLDVFETEPPEPQDPLMQMQNVILTPHTAALTREAVASLAEGAAENAIRVLEGKEPTYSANWNELRPKGARAGLKENRLNGNAQGGLG